MFWQLHKMDLWLRWLTQARFWFCNMVPLGWQYVPQQRGTLEVPSWLEETNYFFFLFGQKDTG